MTLSRRMKYRFAAMTLSFAVLIGGMHLGLHRLRRNVDTAFEEYKEARLLERAEFRAALAHVLLRTQDAARVPRVLEELEVAISLLDEFLAFQDTQSGAESEHESQELRIAESSRNGFRRIAASLDTLDNSTPVSAAGMATDLRKSLQNLGRAARAIDREMVHTQRVADVTLASTVLLTAALSISIACLAALLSLWQYRRVIKPVRLLRDSARRFAAGRFGERVDLTGDDEFVEVGDEFNRMAGELDSLYRDLEEKVRVKSRELVRSERLASVGFLAAGVAHEINNPLNIMSGHAELALQRPRDGAGGDLPLDAIRALEIIRDEAFRCKEITDQLLSLAGKRQENHDAVSVVQIASDVKSLVSGLSQFRDRRLELRFDSHEQLLVAGRRTELKQVLLNLTINALEAVAPGVGEVCIDGRRHNRWVEFSVTDNGCGMTPEIAEHLFEPFFTERKEVKRRGVGLGLSITHAIVEAHGGRISVRSDGPQRGSCLTVRLPAIEARGE